MSTGTTSRLGRKGIRVALLAAAVLAGAGTSRLAATVEEPDAAMIDVPTGALPAKDPATGRVVGYYCTGVNCYGQMASKYSFCCTLSSSSN